MGSREVVPAVWAVIEDADSHLPDALRSVFAEACREIREIEARVKLVERQLEAVAEQLPGRRAAPDHPWRRAPDREGCTERGRRYVLQSVPLSTILDREHAPGRQRLPPKPSGLRPCVTNGAPQGAARGQGLRPCTPVNAVT